MFVYQYVAYLAILLTDSVVNQCSTDTEHHNIGILKEPRSSTSGENKQHWLFSGLSIDVLYL